MYETMDARIKDALDHVERTQGVKILMAVESGSRAWGFESPDSDYDVRFIYVRAFNEYLTVRERRDVLDCHTQGFKDCLKGTPMDHPDLDLVGWDVKKVLALMQKSNPQLLEWINSPVVYRGNHAAVDDLYVLAHKMLRARPVIQHYLHMAKGNYREYLRTPMVRYKKYLYVIRPLLAARWMLERLDPPPVRFDVLNAAVGDEGLGEPLARLLEVKRRSGEAELHPADPALNLWIEDAIRDIEDALAYVMEGPDHGLDLDAEFRDLLYAWAPGAVGTRQ
ncbi:nucleotidyltransferase [Burkholderia phage BcepSaruman]|uniref:Putative nucleotidyltransferase n=1 Tax=Burkholderia phage BcepSaruman TaxID=2530032 RepID=A0A4D5ZET1_9CAUD|nr:nucleotidyltransferase [Burkholderia phage BcepSaruman]QBX06787.1 putative nucleotidyltransferase [Burkholderia phage BcepSaruman]